MTRRGDGDARDGGGGDGRRWGSAKSKGLTAGDLFVRYPDLCPFLLDRLQRATAPLLPASESDSARGPAGDQGLHPELQPVLVLLAQVPPAARGAACAP